MKVSTPIQIISLIDLYILREVIKTFAAIVTLTLLIFLGQSFVKVLQEAASGVLSNQVLLTMVGLESIRVSGVIIPPGFFFAILYTLGRMYRDSEMTALAASGVGTLRIFRSLLLATLPVAILVAWLMFEIRPWAQNQKQLIIESQKQETVELSLAVAGRFNEFQRGNLVFYIEAFSEQEGELRNIFIQKRQQGKPALITAETGYQYFDEESGSHYLVLNDGYRYVGVPGANNYSIGEFEKFSVRIGQAASSENQLSIRAMPTASLIGSADIKKQVEFQNRLMFPLAVFVFAIVSIPLSRSLPREGIYGRLILALLFYFLFMNIQAISGKWMEDGITPLWMGRWWIHPFMLLLGSVIGMNSSQRFGFNMKKLFKRSQ